MQNQKKLICIFLILLLFGLAISSSTVLGYEEISADEKRDIIEIDEDDFDDFEDSLDADDSFNDVSNDLYGLFENGEKRDTPAAIDISKTEVEYSGQPLAPDDNNTYYGVRVEFRDKISAEDFIIIIVCDADSEFILAGVFGDISFFDSPDDLNHYAGYSELGSTIEGDMIVSEDRALLYFPSDWLRANEDPEDLNWLFTVFTDYHGKFVGDICPNEESSGLLSMGWQGFFSFPNLVLFAILALIVVGIVVYARKKARS